MSHKLPTPPDFELPKLPELPEELIIPRIPPDVLVNCHVQLLTVTAHTQLVKVIACAQFEKYKDRVFVLTGNGNMAAYSGTAAVNIRKGWCKLTGYPYAKLNAAVTKQRKKWLAEQAADSLDDAKTHAKRLGYVLAKVGTPYSAAGVREEIKFASRATSAAMLKDFAEMLESVVA